MRKIFVCVGFLLLSFSLVAQVDKDIDKTDELIAAWKNSIKIKIDTYGENHEKVLNDYFSLYDVLIEPYKYPYRHPYYREALTVAEKCVDLCLEIYGEKHAFTAKSYHNLAFVYKMENPLKALEYHQKILAINFELFGEKHLKVADTYIAIGLLYSNMHYHKKDSIRLTIAKSQSSSKSEDFYSRYWYNEIIERPTFRYYSKSETLHPSYWYNDNMVAFREFWTLLPQYDKSLEYFQKALEIKLEVGDGNYKDIIFLYDKMGSVSCFENNNIKAIEYFQKAIEVSKQVLGEKHKITAILYRKTGTIYANEKNISKAIEHFQKALEIYFDEKNKDIVSLHHKMADAYTETGDYDKAISHLRDALSIKLEFLPIEYKKKGFEQFIAKDLNPTRKRYYTKIGAVYFETERYAEAGKYYKLASEFPTRVGEEWLFKYAIVLGNLKKFSSAETLWKLIIPNLQNKLNDFPKNKMSWSGDEYINILNDYYNIINEFYYFTSCYGDDSSKQMASDLIINSKSNGLFSAISYRKLIKDNNSFNYSISKLKEINQKIAQAELLNKNELKQKGWDLNLLRESQDYYVSRLRPKKIRKKLNLTTTNWKEVRRKLKSDEALIDYFTFYNKVDSVWVYHAMLIKKGSNKPIFIPISKTESIDELLKLKNYSPIYILHKEARQEMYSHVWKALEPYLKNTKTIHLVPVTSLNKIDFESLQNDSGQYLTDLFKFHYYTSSRDFATQKQKHKKYADAQLYGHIAYNKARKLAYQIEEDSIDANLKRDKLVPLPATLKEIKIIEKICEENKVSSNTLTIDAVKEDTLAHFSGDRAPDIIHFATHGAYLLPFNEEDETIELASTGQDRFRAADNPLQRAMLMLSNAGETWQNSANILTENDGILTALEVTNLDLSKTELVVLSACNSGVGSQHTTEGVFGLPRAFKLAGVDKILVSLWPVEDETTKELMIQFYTNLLEKKQAAATALRNAKAEMRKRNAAPKKWAGFVLVE